MNPENVASAVKISAYAQHMMFVIMPPASEPEGIARARLALGAIPVKLLAAQCVCVVVSVVPEQSESRRAPGCIADPKMIRWCCLCGGVRIS